MRDQNFKKMDLKNIKKENIEEVKTSRVTYSKYNKFPSKIECRVPEGETENWKVENFEIKEKELGMTIHNMHNPGRGVAPGHYTRLMYKPTRDCMMSNTKAEIRDHFEFLDNAKGHVLINGLGIGIILEALLDNPEVTRITVVEIDEEVIQLTGPSFENEPNVEIIHADAFEYTPPKGIRYGAVWHDIWLYITSDNLEGMKKLHRKYGRKTDWQGSWARWECERQKKEEAKYFW